jgi:hypothetical protein
MSLQYTLVDIIPNSDSSETGQNSEPSIAVNPLNPTQMIAGAFGPINSDNEPYYISTVGGTQWADYGITSNSDKSIAWLTDGSAALTAYLNPSGTVISISLGTMTSGSFGAPISTFNPGHDLDQPWIVIGPSNQVYVAYNDDGADKLHPSTYTASVLVSQSNGSYANVLLDRAPIPNPNPDFLEDAPSVRLAVNGSTAYAAFIRWNSFLDQNSYGDDRYNASVMIVSSANAGADNFTALGTGGNGVQIASTISAFSNEDSNTNNSPLTLGQERTGSDLAIAVDPNNAAHVVVAYTNAPGAANSNPSQLQLVLMESFNGGVSWNQDYTISSSTYLPSTRSAQPALAISSNGTIGLLYDNYDPATNQLSQHFLATMDDFATVNDTTLGTESNSTPAFAFDPYVGDFFNLISIGNTFYGTFSASNADNGNSTSGALFPTLTLQRAYTGTPGTSSFQLTNGFGTTVPFSIDPFFFSVTVVPPTPTGPNAPPPFATSADMILSNASAGGFYQIYDIGNNAILASSQLGQVGTNWQFAGLGNFFDGDTSDMLLRNSGTGNFQVYDISNNNITNSNPMGAVGLNWQVAGFGQFSQSAMSGMMMRNSGTGAFQVYGISNNSIVNTAALGPVGLNWQVGTFGNFSSLGETDMILSNTSTGGLQVYDISNNQITYSALIGTVGTNWQIVGAGNFSSILGESDMMMRNTSTGAFQVYDIANNQITASFSVGAVGLDWQVAGFGPISPTDASDMVLRNTSTGQFLVYNISHNAITANSSLGTVGLNWQVGGFAVDPPTAAPASTNSSAAVGQLVQAMAGFGGDYGTTESFNSAAVGVDTPQQPLLTTPQHG